MRAKIMFQALAIILALALACGIPALAAAPQAAQDGLTGILNYLDRSKALLTFANEENQSDWKAFALARGGKTVPLGYLASAAMAVKANKLNPQGKPNESTDYARAVLVLTAMGYDARDFAGKNLLEPLKNINFVKNVKPLGPAFTLRALNCHSAYAGQFPAGYDLALVALLLDEFNALTGWSAGGPIAGVDIDTTAMVLESLAPYRSDPGVAAATETALALLRAEQFPSGKFGSDWGGGWHPEDACSTAEVVTMLSVLGLNAIDYFEHDALAALLAFQGADGGFDYHSVYGENPFADAQAAYALVAFDLFMAGGSLYDMSGKTLTVYEEAPVETELTRLEKWEAKLPGWLSGVKALPDWFEWVVYYMFFGWIWDVIYK